MCSPLCAAIVAAMSTELRATVGDDVSTSLYIDLSYLCPPATNRAFMRSILPFGSFFGARNIFDGITDLALFVGSRNLNISFLMRFRDSSRTAFA